MIIKNVPINKIKRVVIKNPADATIDLITYDNIKAINELLHLQDIVSVDVEKKYFFTPLRKNLLMYTSEMDGVLDAIIRIA